jgi:hypothetical protein
MTASIMPHHQLLFSLPLFSQDQGCDTADKKGGGRVEPARAANKIIGEVWQGGDATNFPRLGRHGDRRRGLLSDAGTQHRTNCSIQRRAVD